MQLAGGGIFAHDHTRVKEKIYNLSEPIDHQESTLTMDRITHYGCLWLFIQLWE
jgi:aspartokinase-like uncharacterized kinase